MTTYSELVKSFRAKNSKPKTGWRYEPWSNPDVERIGMKPGGLVEPGVTHYGKKDYSGQSARIKETKELMKVRKKIDTWTKNWLDKNINKYEIRELELFKEDLAKAWQKELKANPKEYVTTMRGGTPFKSTAIDGLSPNVSDRRFGKTPFKYLGEEVGDKLTIKTFWNKIFYHNHLKDKAFKKKTLDWMNHYIAGKAHVNQYNRKAYEAKTAKLLDDDVIYFLSRDSGLDGHTRKAVMERAFPEANPKYRAKLDKMSQNYKMSEDILDEFFGTKNILNQASVKEHQALAKIFDVSELPKSLRLNYNMDHIYGVSEAVREIKKGNPDKKFIRSILNNTWGMSAKRNEELGTKWYSFQRKDLANKIEKGINAEANLQKLNKLTKKAYGVDNAYQVVKGNVRPTKSFAGQTQPERFASYFKEIAKTKEGAAAIKKQHGSLKKLLSTFWCGRKVAAEGGRIGFKAGSGCPVEVRQRNFLALTNDVAKGRVTGEAAEQITKNAAKVVGKVGSKSALAAIFGIGGIGLDLAYEVGSVGTDMAMNNVSFKEAMQNNWLTGAFIKGTGQEEYHKGLFAKDSSAKPFGTAMDLLTRIEEEENILNKMRQGSGRVTTSEEMLSAQKDKIADLYSFFDKLARKEGGRYLALEQGSPEQVAYERAKLEYDSGREATAPIKRTSKAGFEQMVKEGAQKRPYSKYGYEAPEKYGEFTKNQLDEILKQFGSYGPHVSPQTFGFKDYADLSTFVSNYGKTWDVAQTGGVANMKSGGKVDYDNYLPDIDDDK